jgi:hypothetical protein
MTDSRSTLDDEVDDEPAGDSRETCILWVPRSGECRREAPPFAGSEPCPDCPLTGDGG